MTVMPPDIKPTPAVAAKAPPRWAELFHRLMDSTGIIAPVALRVSLAVTFIWFGALKVTGASPVSDLVVGTVPGAEAHWFIPLLGAFEVALGLALLAGAHPLVLLALVLHLCGTFGVLVAQPEVAFQDGNILELTTEGEFVVKNLVLISATLAVAAFSMKSRSWSPVSSFLVAVVGASAGAMNGALAGALLQPYADGLPWVDVGIVGGALVGAVVALLVDRQLVRVGEGPGA